MVSYIKKLSPIALLVSAVFLCPAAYASDANTDTVTVQTEVSADEIPLMTDILYEAALADAAAKTVENNKDWFRVIYRDVQTQSVTRNADNDAESRYLDLESGEREEQVIQTNDVIVQVQKIDFTMGVGPKPVDENSFLARELILPDI